VETLINLIEKEAEVNDEKASKKQKTTNWKIKQQRDSLHVNT
jgi:hypothetical protein